MFARLMLTCPTFVRHYYSGDWSKVWVAKRHMHGYKVQNAIYAKMNQIFGPI